MTALNTVHQSSGYETLPLPQALPVKHIKDNEIGEKVAGSGNNIEGLEAKILALSDHEYETTVKKIAKELNVRISFLDAIRKKNKPEDKSVQGRKINLEHPDPWEETINGSELLNELVVQIKRFLIAPEYSVEVIALWVILTYLSDHASVLPMLVFNSSTKRCGKTTALEIVLRLSLKALPASTISSAALFRSVEKFGPTLIIDETDSIFKDNEDLRTLINASFSRTAAYAIRCSGEDQDPRMFSTWCPKALALIGRLPSTLSDRSVLIPMKRKASEEKTDRLRADQDQGFEDLKRKIERWCQDNVEEIKKCDPSLPDGLNDRQADAWRELIRIADIASIAEGSGIDPLPLPQALPGMSIYNKELEKKVAGSGNWGTLAREAAMVICSAADDDDDLKTSLLRDLRNIFLEDKNKTHWLSSDIILLLRKEEDRPWASMGNGKGFTVNALAKILGSFDIHPGNVKSEGHVRKAYKVADFTDIFIRYLKTAATYDLFDTNSNTGNELKGSGIGSGSFSEPLPEKHNCLECENHANGKCPIVQDGGCSLDFKPKRKVDYEIGLF